MPQLKYIVHRTYVLKESLKENGQQQYNTQGCSLNNYMIFSFGSD